MAKLKQHYMLKDGHGVHPIFRFAYLPENIASLVETILLFVISLFVIVFVSGLLIAYMHIYTSGNALLYIYSSLVDNLANFLSISNSEFSYIFLAALSGLTFYLVRKYFEFVKYNLHLLRTEERNKAKRDD